MLTVSPSIKILVYTRPMDMRKGFNGLSGVVRGELQSDPMAGHLYLFLNKRRDRLKILHFDGGGYWLYYRLLEAGTFEELAAADSTRALEIDATQLTMLLAGVSLASSSRRRKRFMPPTKAGAPQESVD
jgi:transposase